MPPRPRQEPDPDSTDSPAPRAAGQGRQPDGRRRRASRTSAPSPLTQAPTWGLLVLAATALAVAWAWPGLPGWVAPALSGCGLMLLLAVAVRRRPASPAGPEVADSAAPRNPQRARPSRRAHRDRQPDAPDHGADGNADAASQAALLLATAPGRGRRAAPSPDGPAASQESLTALANRVRFGACVTQAIAQAQAPQGPAFAVLYLDFDRFQQIQQTLGPAAVDQFQAQVCRRVTDAVRPDDTVGRLGVDEFAVLVEGLPDQATVLALAERLQQRLARPYAMAGQELQAPACIGITFSDHGYAQAGDVLRDADQALQRARAQGRGRTQVFDAAWRLQRVDPAHTVQALQQALQLHQLTLVYQPICDLVTGQVDSFEALLRWQHPQLGPVPPAVLLPLAQAAGLMAPLTDLVLRTACRQFQAMQQQLPAHWMPRLHLNVAASDLARPDFARLVVRTLAAHRLDPRQLTLEVTQASLSTSDGQVVDEMKALRALGVDLSLDDFGHGQDDAAELAHWPVNGLKLAASLVAGLRTGGPATEAVRAALTLGEALGKQVVAKGIEHPAQLQALRLLGCRKGQGYLLARPLLPDLALAVALSRHQPLIPPVPVLGEEMVIDQLPLPRPRPGMPRSGQAERRASPP